jgi:hypothetical protein
MRKAIGIAITAAAMATSGCGHTHDDGDGGATVQRNYQVGPFQQIEVAGPYDVDVHTGGAPAVSASGPQRLIDRLVVEVSGEKLLIHPKEEHGFFHFGWNSNRSAAIHVTVPALSGATIAGSGGITVDKVGGDSFEGNVTGSGDLTLNQLALQSLKLSIGGSGDVQARSGQAANVEYDIAGSGGIDAAGVRAQSAKATVAGSGDIKGQVTGTANVSIMGSGDVTLTGGAKCTVSKMGSGDAHCS